MKRTKSAWTVEKDGITLSMGGQVVATAIAPDGASIEEQRGNAALIAAAPELLAVLMYLRDCIEIGIDPAMSSVNGAIAKATGVKM